MESLDDFLKLIPVIENTSNYWFFRTDGGRLYDPFFQQDLIALDYAKIPDEKSRFLINGDISEAKIKAVKDIYPNQRRPGLIIANLKRFYFEMKKGDYVVIPSISGKNIAVGEITGDVANIEGIKKIRSDGRIFIDEEYRRSRKINWITAMRRGNFSPELYRLLNTHQTISNANRYAEWIDNLLYAIYKKDDKYHYIVNINQRYGISAKTVYWTFYELLDITDKFLKEINIDETTDDIDTKISLNSPGYIEFLGNSGRAIALLCILILFINGGGFKIKIGDKFSLDLSTSGIIKRLNEFLNSQKDRGLKKRLEEKIVNLEIEKSGDVVKILNSINKENQNRPVLKP
jgi:hypothetical protein